MKVIWSSGFREGQLKPLSPVPGGLAPVSVFWLLFEKAKDDGELWKELVAERAKHLKSGPS